MKKIDADLLVIKRCCKALESSSSKIMLRANMEFLIDKYVTYNHKVVLKKKNLFTPTASLGSQG